MNHNMYPFLFSLFFCHAKRMCPRTFSACVDCQKTALVFLFSLRNHYLFCSQVWFPTVQDVLHADWHDVWHSPHPPFFTVLFNVCVFNVLICFIVISSFALHYFCYYTTGLYVLKAFFLTSVKNHLRNHSSNHPPSGTHQKCRKNIAPVPVNPPVYPKRYQKQQYKINNSKRQAPSKSFYFRKLS